MLCASDHPIRGGPVAHRITLSALVAGLVVFSVPSQVGRVAAQTPASEDAAMIARLGVPEAATPVRERPGWTRPTRVVVMGLGSSRARLAQLQAAVPEVELVPASSAAAARTAAASADALIGSCDASVIAAGPSIRWVQHHSAGVEACLESPVIKDRGILLTNVQGVLAPTMAEHVIGMALAFGRRLTEYVEHQRGGLWRRASTPEFTLNGKTMLLAGLGGVGTAVADRAHALGMTVIAVRNSTRPGPPSVSRVGQSEDLLSFVKEADIVVDTLPLTDETRGTFNAKVFSAMKPGTWFINVGRGETVVTADLVAALQSGQLAGAGLDVVDPEPLPPDHPLWRMPNVIITPHVAANSEMNIDSRWLIYRANLRRYLVGDRMLAVVDADRGY
jgi:phosphoglycerate dehydrogenase-like enzyme